jgi:hypothetical protein
MGDSTTFILFNHVIDLNASFWWIFAKLQTYKNKCKKTIVANSMIFLEFKKNKY